MNLARTRRVLSIGALCVGLSVGVVTFAAPASATDDFRCDLTQGEFGSFHVKACVGFDDMSPSIRGRAYLTLDAGHSDCTYTIRLQRNGVDVAVSDSLECPGNGSGGAFAGPKFTSWYVPNLPLASYAAYASITRKSDGLRVTSNTADDWLIICPGCNP
jgi:hypothetical protein